MIDTHCHLTFPNFQKRLPEVLADAAAHGVDRMITIGTQLTDAPALAALADRFDNVWFTVGLHPHDASKWVGRAEEIATTLRGFAAHPKCVALGEMGMDRHYPDPPIEHQREVFAAQLAVCADLDLPIVIHNREATDDTLAVIRESEIAGERFIFHCFTGEPEEVDRILDLGAMVGFTGVVTFGSAKNVAAASDRVPLDRLLIETDSPYLTPEPFRKVRPNEPRYVAEVAKFLAKRRGMALKDFVAAVDGNAERVFGKALSH